MTERHKIWVGIRLARKSSWDRGPGRVIECVGDRGRGGMVAGVRQIHNAADDVWQMTMRHFPSWSSDSEKTDTNFLYVGNYPHNPVISA